MSVWTELRRYAYGAPPVRLEINAVSPEQILAEIAAERRRGAIEAEATPAVGLLPEAVPEPS